jgi:hypothetical protein
MLRGMSYNGGPCPGTPGHWATELENCEELIEPRLVDGARKRIVVGLEFTIQGDATDEANIMGFRQRMESFAQKLETLNGCSVEALNVNRRKGKRPWAEFTVLLPTYFYPKVPDLAA